MYSTLDESSGLGKQIGYAILTGIGCGNTLQPALVAVQAGVDRKDMAVVTSFRNFTRNFGGTIGLAIAGLVINNVLRVAVDGLGYGEDETRTILSSPQRFVNERTGVEADQVRAAILPAYQEGFRVIFLVGASLAAFAFVLSFFLMPHIELNKPDDAKLKAEGKEWQKSRIAKKEEEVSEKA